MSVLVPVILLLVFLLPPYLMASHVVRLQRRIGWLTKSRGLALATAFFTLAAVINVIFVFNHMPEISAGQLQFDTATVVALLISWICIWVRFAITTMRRRHRKIY